MSDVSIGPFIAARSRVRSVEEAAGMSALYVDARNTESLAAGLTALLSDPAARARSGRAARERARSEDLWDAVADAYETLLGGS